MFKKGLVYDVEEKETLIVKKKKNVILDDEDDENVLCSDSIKNTKCFKNLSVNSQLSYYKQNRSSETVLRLVELESKGFGSIMEKIIIEQFNLGKRTSSQNDATLNGVKFEIKSARYWSGIDDCKWQHIELHYDYQYILFALLDFDEIKCWCLSKDKLIELSDRGIVKKQGIQGYWTEKSKIMDYLTPVKNVSELEKYINSN